jgi:MSHA pilin protein MshD
VSLIELVVFVVVVSASVAGVLIAIDRAATGSADPLVIKQALAIAEGLLEEVELMPFTFCDPDDAQSTTATSPTIGATGCATVIEGIGPEAGETRYSASTPFDNVNDYNGYDSATEGGIRDITNTLITEVAAYRATIAVAPVALGGIASTDANGQANVLLITVTVTGPANTTVVLNGYRTKYSPRI